MDCSRYAFESYCTTAAKPSELAKGAALPPDEEPGWGGNVNTNVQWCAICRTCVQAVLSAKSYAADRTDFIRNLEGVRGLRAPPRETLIKQS